MPRPTSLDTTKLIEQAQRKLGNQTNTLQDTLDTIELIQQLDTNNPGAYTPALTAARIKRDRQAAAIRMTQSFIEALKKAPKKA